MAHIPVLQKEILEHLNPKSNENFIDCTIGEGGHALAVLERNGPEGRILGIDRDPEIIKNLRFKLQALKLNQRITFVCDNFANLTEITRKEKFRQISGIILDLGMSSWHLAESKRGFSFQRNEPLDMRYNPQSPFTAGKIVNYWSGAEIEKILREYGEERFSREIARGIIETRGTKPIKTTFELVKIIERAVPGWYQRKRIHFATRTFQALRITVNDELNNLATVLPQTLKALEKGGRLVAISFHSLEDKIIKNLLKDQAKEGLLKLLTKKPVRPSGEEVKINPRSRSARLRAAQRL